MTATYLEIVQLENGDFALQRSDESDSLVTISFSAEARESLQEHAVTVARNMMGAGLECLGELRELDDADEEFDEAVTVH